MRIFRRSQAPAEQDATSDFPLTDESVYCAYKMLLRREPDPDGLAHYRRLVANGATLDDLIRHFVESEEFRVKQDADRAARVEYAQPAAVDLGGYQVSVRRTEQDFGRAIFQSQQYEEHVREAVRAHVRPGHVVLDVGANVGVITMLAASIVGPQGRVIAVEPNPDNLQLLYRGIVLNQFTNIEVLAWAASNARSVFSLTGGTSNTHLIPVQPTSDTGFFAQAVVLDEVLGDLPRLDFVKMDIEGHEPQAMQGLQRLLTRHRPVLLTEFNPRCLVNLQDRDPLAFLQQILALYPRVRVTSAFADDITFERPDEALAYWHQRNRDITDKGLLPDGMLHFDLVATS